MTSAESEGNRMRRGESEDQKMCFKSAKNHSYTDIWLERLQCANITNTTFDLELYTPEARRVHRSKLLKFGWDKADGLKNGIQKSPAAHLSFC